MHTITDCPRCGIDFMYHNTDYHLRRDVPNNIELETPPNVQDLQKETVLEFVVICQDCHEVEGISNYIEEKAESRGWENAEFMAEITFGKSLTKKAMAKFTDESRD